MDTTKKEIKKKRIQRSFQIDPEIYKQFKLKLLQNNEKEGSAVIEELISNYIKS